MTTIVDCEQGSETWFRARMGRPTASEFATVLAKGKGGGPSLTRRAYLYRLAAEIISDEPAETYSNAHMDRGKALEPEARDLYAFMTNTEPVRVGFIHNETAGASPDSLIGNAGALEIKTKLPHLLIECILADEFPPEHKAQCQGVLWVGGREWIDIAVYWPKLPLFIKRAYRDENYIADLAAKIAEFNAELAEIVTKVRAYGEAA
jgi:hypothetical protein